LLSISALTIQVYTSVAPIWKLAAGSDYGRRLVPILKADPIYYDKGKFTVHNYISIVLALAIILHYSNECTKVLEQMCRFTHAHVNLLSATCVP